MTVCNRFGNFGEKEIHQCFKCGRGFLPIQTETCTTCNWKKCIIGHCGCDLSKETREVLDKFYDLFCKPQDYSKETKKALFSMINVYFKYCKNFLK